MRDINIIMDGIRLNVRVGMIFKYHDEVLLEIPKDKKNNAVIPGGRVKINESSYEALSREIQEELNFFINSKKTIFKNVIESFFEFDGIKVHEIFFVYQYLIDEHDYQKLLQIKENQDNHKTEIRFVKTNDLIKVNLLPLEVIDLIKE